MLSHTRWSGGRGVRSCTGEREVERVEMLISCLVHSSEQVSQNPTHGEFRLLETRTNLCPCVSEEGGDGKGVGEVGDS